MAVDTARIEAAVVELLAAIGENPEREGLTTTPHRVAEAYQEFFSGIGVDPLEHLAGSVPIDDVTDAAGASGATVTEAAGDDPGRGSVPRGSVSRLGEVVLLRDIAFRSICEHHLLPFLGMVHLAYIPGAKLVGLGKLPRVVDTIASRPQMQERLTEQIADALDDGLDPRGVLVVVDAVHGCVTARGVRQAASSTVTVASRGELSRPVDRAEIMALIGAGSRAGTRTGS